MRRTFFQTKFSKALLAIMLFLVLAWWDPTGLMKPVASAIQIGAFPIERFASFLFFEIRDTFGFLSSIGELKSDNERLVRENLDLMAEQAALRDIRSENDALRKEYGLAPRDRYELLSAEVIGEDFLAPGRSLLINQGSGAGVAVGMPVVVGKGALIGKIEEVFLGSARVRLLSHGESLVPVVTTETGAQGMIRGEHGLGVFLDMVPKTDVLKRGDAVVTSGLGGEFPRGLFLGTLQDPRATNDKLFQQSSVIAPVKYSEVRFVSVILFTKL